MTTIKSPELYKVHRQMIDDQGRKRSWIAKQLECSRTLIDQYLNGTKNMSQEKVIALHNLLK
ncbi:hypothetical protein [Paenibacillus odorifer]|uniref:hypothetical protein n=1 Tax=Paenibacillus odorifer TaxID=189426 RepID=UPI00096D3C1C|nr:hypothetical protein [Paenibacillus odorifer]OME41427.1 hypothetical protein BSK58_14950 [Paenibacillus odorifer]